MAQSLRVRGIVPQQVGGVVPLRVQFPNLMLRVRRAIRLCEITLMPAREKYIELYCSVRTMQGATSRIHPRKDVAIMMVALLHDWQNGSNGVWLADKTKKLQRKMCRLLCLQFPGVALGESQSDDDSST